MLGTAAGWDMTLQNHVPGGGGFSFVRAERSPTHWVCEHKCKHTAQGPAARRSASGRGTKHLPETLSQHPPERLGRSLTRLSSKCLSDVTRGRLPCYVRGKYQPSGHRSCPAELGVWGESVAAELELLRRDRHELRGGAPRMRRGGKWPLESARDGVVWVGMGWCRGLEGHRALTYDHQQKSSWTRSAELKGGAWPGWGEMSPVRR